jgi:hypothetical protein
MPISMPYKRCGETIVAEHEDDLVRRVTEHAQDRGGAHGRHVPSRERILAHLPARAPKND